MRPKSVVGFAVLLAAALWLGLNQMRLESKLINLEKENKRLSEEISNRPVASANPSGEMQTRLADTELALSLAEQRLSNLTARLNTLPPKMERTFRSGPALPRGTFIVDAEEPRPPASSHTPSGELLDRSWGPEQLLGPPNTTQAGDIPTAWASRNPNGGEEWLKLDYAQAVDLVEVRVRETYHPGAIAKVAALLPNGQEVSIWEGYEPPAQAPVDTSFPVNVPVRSASVKIYLDTHRVSGWNEIDAVELVGRDGTRQWAIAATASSTFAEQ